MLIIRAWGNYCHHSFLAYSIDSSFKDVDQTPTIRRLLEDNSQQITKKKNLKSFCKGKIIVYYWVKSNKKIPKPNNSNNTKSV